MKWLPARRMNIQIPGNQPLYKSPMRTPAPASPNWWLGQDPHKKFQLKSKSAEPILDKIAAVGGPAGTSPVGFAQLGKCNPIVDTTNLSA